MDMEFLIWIGYGYRDLEMIITLDTDSDMICFSYYLLVSDNFGYEYETSKNFKNKK